MKHLLIDTNIWIRTISQGKPGCEVEHLRNLQKLIDKSQIVLLLPEVIKLETEKNWISFPKDVDKYIKKLEKDMETLIKKEYWTEIEDITTSLEDFIKDKKNNKLNSAAARYKIIENIFESEKTELIPFTPEINFEASRRIMAGRFPTPERNAHSDACIIESLKEYYIKDGKKDEHELCFCSENATEFAFVGNDRHFIHPIIRADLPLQTEYCISLEQVIDFYESGREVKIPSEEELKEAHEVLELDDFYENIEFNEQAVEHKCDVPTCYATKYFFSRFCPHHHHMYISRLKDDEVNKYKETIEQILRTLTYREREVLKLRWGLGDGYTYTPSECGRIFRISPQHIGRIESQALNKLSTPEMREQINNAL